MPTLGSYLQRQSGDVDLRSHAHASRLYVSNFYALAPKTSWIYYVEFNINPDAITDPRWNNQKRITEVGMLVKSTDLPKFTVGTEVVNQYNRKTVIQKNISYTPITMTMHDDHSNVVHNMWLNYYRYYFADSQYGGTGPIGTAGDNSNGAFLNNKYLPSNDLTPTTEYGYNSELVVDPFFESIKIYQLNRQVFTSYELVNPVIKSWEHDQLDQKDGQKFATSRMSIEYEAVFYDVGTVDVDSPTGFAVFHYDHRPSPLGVSGNVLGSALGIFGDPSGLLDPGSSRSPLDILSSVLNNTNLLSDAVGNRNGSFDTNGYSILSNITPSAGTGGLNGLGVDLNLNLGNNYLTAGNIIASPSDILSPLGIGRDLGNRGVFTQSPNSNGIPPTITPIVPPDIDISGSDSVQTEPDPEPTTPSPESEFFTSITNSI